MTNRSPRKRILVLTETVGYRHSSIPIVTGGIPITTGTFLIRLTMHTSFHNGQINYHRRLLASGGAPA